MKYIKIYEDYVDDEPLFINGISGVKQIKADLLIGVTTTTLRRCESSGSLISHHQTI